MIIFGIALALVSGLCGVSGKQLIRYSELQRTKSLAAKDGGVRRALLFRVAGVLLTGVIGPAIDTMSYGFAAQSLIAPLTGLDIIWNIIIAPWTLGEKLTMFRAFAAVLIAAGTSLTLVFGNQLDTEYTLEYVQELFFSTRVLIYLACLASFVFTNVCYFSRLVPGDIRRGLSLGITAGTIAGNMFCVKATAEMFKGIFNGHARVWLHWVPWMCLAGMIFFALSNLRLMERGMREHEVLFMATLYQGAHILSGCLSGAVVLRELDHFPLENIVGYAFSVLVIVAGIAALWVGEVCRRPRTPVLEDSLASGVGGKGLQEDLEALPERPGSMQALGVVPDEACEQNWEAKGVWDPATTLDLVECDGQAEGLPVAIFEPVIIWEPAEQDNPVIGGTAFVVAYRVPAELEAPIIAI